MWSEQRLLVRRRFAPIWHDLPQLTLLTAFHGWGRSVWLQQCLEYVETNVPGAACEQAVTRTQFARLLGERGDAEQRIVVADGLVNSVDDELWPKIADHLRADPTLRVVMTSIDPPHLEAFSGIELLRLSSQQLAFTKAETEAYVDLVAGPGRGALAELVGDGSKGHPAIIARQLRNRLAKTLDGLWDASEHPPEVHAFALTSRNTDIAAPSESCLWRVLRVARELRSFSARQLQLHLEGRSDCVGVSHAEAFEQFRHQPLFTRVLDFEFGEERIAWVPSVWQQVQHESTDAQRTSSNLRALETARRHGRLADQLFYLLSLERTDDADKLVADNYQQMMNVLDAASAALVNDLTVVPRRTPSLAILQAEVRISDGAKPCDVRELLEGAHAALLATSVSDLHEQMTRATMLAYAATFLGDRVRARRYLARIRDVVDGPLGRALQRASHEIRSQTACQLGLLVWAAMLNDEPALALKLGRGMLLYGSDTDREQSQRRDTLASIEDFFGLRSIGARSTQALGAGVLGDAVPLRLIDEGQDAAAVAYLAAPMAVRIATAALVAWDTMVLFVRGIAQPDALTSREVHESLERAGALWGSAAPSTMLAFAAFGAFANLGDRESAAALVARLADQHDVFARIVRSLWSMWNGDFAAVTVELTPETLGELPRIAALGRVLLAAAALRTGQPQQAAQQLREAWALVEAPPLLRFALRYVPQGIVDEFSLLGAELEPGLRDALDQARGDARHVHWQPAVQLTRSEAEVLQLLARGLKNTEIATHRHVSIDTVRSQLKSLYRKLEVTNRDEAIDASHRLRLLPHEGGGGASDAYPRQTAADR